MSEGFFPKWKLAGSEQGGQIVGPNERLPWPQMIAMGMQHVVAMFGATVIAPLLMGFDPNIAIMMSGIGTLVFFVFVGGRVPSYLGSSFAFIGSVMAATAYAGQGLNPNIAPALGGIIVCGALYTAIGLLVVATGTKWIEALMPPVVTGAIVSVLGLNLAGVAIKNVGSGVFATTFALFTIVAIGFIAVGTNGLVRRLMLLLGVIVSYVVYVLLTNGSGLGKPIDFSTIANAGWFGVPTFTAPTFTLNGITLIAPVALILVAENLGHVKAVAAITGTNLDRYVGRAFIGDGVATMISGSSGGTGMTTYAENIGVMAMTKIYSSLIFVIAAVIALVLGFSPKFGALILSIPAPILGGVSMVVFGLIVVAGVRIWINHDVDLTSNKNLIVSAAILIMGTGDFTLQIGSFSLHGIGTATFGGIALNALLSFIENRFGNRIERKLAPNRLSTAEGGMPAQ